MSVYVYIDSEPENMIPELALKADSVLDGKWNGLLRPLATAAAFNDFLSAWRANDPNGVWGHAIETSGRLSYQSTDYDGDTEDLDYFPRVGVTSDGTPLYDLTGWVWVTPDSDQ